jgi:hypothetical protein
MFWFKRLGPGALNVGFIGVKLQRPTSAAAAAARLVVGKGVRPTLRVGGAA